MKINIVVYGCDNTGKSTLCHQLVDTLTANSIPAYYIKSLGPASLPNQVAFVSKNLSQVDRFEVNIFDRFPIIEEEICGSILRNHNTFSSFPDFIDRALNQIALFIHCDPGLNKITDWGSREQMEGIKENAIKLNEAYGAYKVIHGLEARTIEYNFLKDSWQDIAKLLLDYCALLNKEVTDEHN